MKLLEEVERALAAEDHAGALRAALAAWRDTRAACVADAVDALSAKALKKFKPPPAKANAKVHEAWMALAKEADPVAMGWLAEHAAEKLPGNHYGQCDAFDARMKAIRKTPDPRFAAAVVRLVDEEHVRAGFVTCCDVLEVAGDERSRAALDRWIAVQEHDRAKKKLIKTREALPAITPVTGEALVRWCAIAGRPDPRLVEERDQLLAAVYAAPDDDRPRAVLADRLQELGDPLGELIVLQLAEESTPPTDEAYERATALVAANFRTWLGGLMRVAINADFRRGFPSRIELGGSWKTERWDDHTTLPQLATVNEIEAKARPDIVARFIASPAMRGLSRVLLDSDPVLEALEARLPPSLREVCSTTWKKGSYARRFEQRVLPLVARLPVHTLEFSPAFDPLLVAERCPGLTHLSPRGMEHEDAFALWPRLPPRVTRLSWGGYYVRVELRRAGSDVECILEPEFTDTDVDDLVAGLKKFGPARIQILLDADDVGRDRGLGKKLARALGSVAKIVRRPRRSGSIRHLSSYKPRVE